jgi:hypothetical protein
MIKELYQQALISYKIYLVMAPSTPLDVVALKWPDIAEAAITNNQVTLGDDLLWMIYEPIRIIYSATLERAIEVLGRAPAIKWTPPAFSKTAHASNIIKDRDSMVREIDELLGLVRVMTNVEYPKLSKFLEVSCK